MLDGALLTVMGYVRGNSVEWAPTPLAQLNMKLTHTTTTKLVVACKQ